MNWVGGIRQRVKQKNDRKIQREYFERQRKVAKISKIKPELAEKEISTNKTISQDLLFLYPLSGNAHSGPSSLSCKKPVKFVDLSKRRPSRVKHHMKLGPDCPDGFPKSILEFHGAIDERKEPRSNRHGMKRHNSPNPETPLPRCILDKQIADAERRLKSHPSRDVKYKELKASTDNTTKMQTVCSYGEEIPGPATAFKTKNTSNGRNDAAKPSKRYFPQKPDINLHGKSQLLDDNDLDINVQEDFSRFLRREESQLVPALNKKDLDLDKENQMLDDWVKKICPRKETPCVEKREYPNNAWQKCLDVVSISKVAEKQIVFSVQPEKQFPSNSLEIHQQSKSATHLHHKGKWISDELLGESSGHFKARFPDINNQLSCGDYAYINETEHNFIKSHEIRNQGWDSKTNTSHDHPSASEQEPLNRRKLSVVVRDCKNEFGRNLPAFADSPSCSHRADIFQRDQQCIQSSDFQLDQMGNFDDDSEEDRFRQAMFKQKPSQQLAFDVKNNSDLDLEVVVTRVNQAIDEADVTVVNLEMPQSVPEAYAEVMEMGEGTISDDQRSSSGDNDMRPDFDPSLENKEAITKQTPMSTTWNNVSYHSPLQSEEKRNSVTLASLGPSADEESETCQPIQCLSFGCSPDYKVTHIASENVALSGLKNDMISRDSSNGSTVGTSPIQSISTEVQTDDLLCHNCGCSVCDVLGEINASYRNDVIKKQNEFSAAVLEADACIKLDASPNLLVAPVTKESAPMAQRDVKDTDLQQPVSLAKNVAVDVSHIGEGCHRNFPTSSETESRKRHETTRGLRDKEYIFNLTCNAEDAETSGKSDTSPTASPCVIQTRSKTAKRIRGK